MENDYDILAMKALDAIIKLNIVSLASNLLQEELLRPAGPNHNKFLEHCRYFAEAVLAASAALGDVLDVESPLPEADDIPDNVSELFKNEG